MLIPRLATLVLTLRCGLARHHCRPERSATPDEPDQTPTWVTIRSPLFDLSTITAKRVAEGQGTICKAVVEK